MKNLIFFLSIAISSNIVCAQYDLKMKKKQIIQLPNKDVSYYEVSKQEASLMLQSGKYSLIDELCDSSRNIEVYNLNTEGVLVGEKGYFSLFRSVEELREVMESYESRKDVNVGFNDDGEDFIVKIDSYVNELKSLVGAEVSLDLSEESLFNLDVFIDSLPNTEAFIATKSKILIAYLGEVVRKRIGGNWQLRKDNQYLEPYIERANEDIDIETWYLKTIEDLRGQESALEMTYQILKS